MFPNGSCRVLLFRFKEPACDVLGTSMGPIHQLGGTQWLFCGKKQDKKPIMDHEIKHLKSSYIILWYFMYIYCWNIHENMAEKSLMHSTLPYQSPPRWAHSVMMYKTYLIASQLTRHEGESKDVPTCRILFQCHCVSPWCKQHRSEYMKKFCDRLLLES